MILISGINDSGLYAAYSVSAEKDNAGNVITATYMKDALFDFTDSDEISGYNGSGFAVPAELSAGINTKIENNIIDVKNVSCSAIGSGNIALGTSSIADGKNSFIYGLGGAGAAQNIASGDHSIVLGWHSKAIGRYSTVLGGNYCLASADVDPNYEPPYSGGPVAQGLGTSSLGHYTHSEGIGTIASNQASHAEGGGTSAIGVVAHAEGDHTLASGDYSHAEGKTTFATGNGSHAEGGKTSAIGTFTHAEGTDTKAAGEESHAEGWGTFASGHNSHAEGKYTTAAGHNSHAEGDHTLANYCAHAEGDSTSADGSYSHAEGQKTIASNNGAHAEGQQTSALSLQTHAEGGWTVAKNNGAHAEGLFTSAIGYASHTEGYRTSAAGMASHAEGYYASALSDFSHAEGLFTSAIGYASHTEGSATLANGSFTHAEGYGTSALLTFSHAEGNCTIANSYAMHAEGMYNKTSADALFVIGNGSAETARSDAFIVTSGGLASAVILATSGISDVESAIDSLSSNLDSYVKYTDIQYAIGSANTATGSTTSRYSVALGNSNSAYNSFVIGNYNKGKESHIFGDSNSGINSYIVGYNCTGTESYLFGKDLSGKSWGIELGDFGDTCYPVIVGRQNATKTSAYFVVGCGNTLGNADAFIVSSNKVASAADFKAGNGVSLSSLTGLATSSWVNTHYGKKTNDVYYIKPDLPYDLYSSTATYAVGDKVVCTAGSGSLYSAKSAVTTPGAWSTNSSKFAGVSDVTFTAENEDITELYDGLKIALYLPSRLAATNSYLNINGLGDVPLYRNNVNKLTSGYFPVSGVVIDFTYVSATNRWVWADYDSNSTYAGMVDAYVNLSASATNISAACTNFSARPGNTINVTFPRDYTAVSAKKFIAGTSTYQPLYLNGSATSNTNYLIPSGTWPVYYDGNNWYLWTDGSIQFSAIRGTVIGGGGGSTLTAGTDLKIENDVISVNTNGTAMGDYAFVAGYSTVASGTSTFAIGNNTSAKYSNSVAMGISSIANKAVAFAHGDRVSANGYASHAEGGFTYTENDYAHAEGYSTSAFSKPLLGTIAYQSHAEGTYCIASGRSCHAEGENTSAIGTMCHAECKSTLATAYSHAEGVGTSALGVGSHSEGYYTIAKSIAMHAGGKYNATTADALFVLGNGTADYARSDAFVVTSGGLASAITLATSGIPDIEAAITSIPAAVQADWAETVTSNPAYIQNKPDVLIPVDSPAALGGISKPINIMVVSAMPASPDSATIYLVQGTMIGN